MQPTLPATCTGTCAETLYANPNAVGPNSTSAHFFEQQRERKTYSLALQFKPVEQMNIELNALKINANFDHMTQSMFAFQGNTWNSLKTLSDITVKDGLITRASFNNGLIVFDVQNRDADVKSDDLRRQARLERRALVRVHPYRPLQGRRRHEAGVRRVSGAHRLHLVTSPTPRAIPAA
ncbi:MAG: hypothetical protein ACWGG5_07515 [Stenotrophomonas sp.]